MPKPEFEKSPVEAVKIDKLFKSCHSDDVVMLLEGKKSYDQVEVVIPKGEASAVALEAHGLSERCHIYSVLGCSVESLGGAFGGVVIRASYLGLSTYLILVRNGSSEWIEGNLAELISFALHLRMPIYLMRHDTNSKNTDHSENECGIFDTHFAELSCRNVTPFTLEQDDT